jgi:hypothetical protein
MALLRKPDGTELKIVDGEVFAIQNSNKVESINLRQHPRMRGMIEAVITFVDTSVLYTDLDNSRAALAFTRRHRFKNKNVILEQKMYTYEAGTYRIINQGVGKPLKMVEVDN